MRRAFLVPIAALAMLAAATSAAAQEAGAQEPASVDVVRVGALVNDIQQLDLQSHSYSVDMYMWFKWRNPDIDPARSFEFLNASSSGATSSLTRRRSRSAFPTAATTR